MRKLLLTLLFPALGVIVWAGLASAQTATPSPTATPGPTATATTSPTNFGVWWSCENLLPAHAWYCYPTDNGVFHWQKQYMVDGQGGGTYDWVFSIHPPSSVVSATLSCLWGAEDSGGPHTFHLAQVQTYGSSQMNRSGYPALVSITANDVGSMLYRAERGTNSTQLSAWANYAWGFPTLSSHRTAVWGWRAYFNLAGWEFDDQIETAIGEIDIQCQVERYGLYNGDEHNWNDEHPPTATPTPGPSATPTPGGIVWHATPWSSTPAPAEFDLGDPTGQTCITLLPGFSWDDPVFGYEIDVGWDEFTICLTGRSISLILYQFDLGTLVTTMVLVGSFGVFYGWMRGRGG